MILQDDHHVNRLSSRTHQQACCHVLEITVAVPEARGGGKETQKKSLDNSRNTRDLRIFWGLLGISWGLMGISWGPLGSPGVSWGSPGVSWGSPGSLLGIPWGSPGSLLGISRGSPGVSWGSPGCFLGSSRPGQLSCAPCHRRCT